ncbi:MAG: TIGR03118 family protein [Chitinophagaceae bacterium]
MKKTSRILHCMKILAAASLLTIAFAACKKEPPEMIVSLPGNYSQVNLVANTAAYSAVRIDTLLKDAWGLAFSPGGNPWISSRVGSLSTVYNAEGAQARGPVYIPSPNGPFGGAFGGSPTGQVFNASTDFVLPNGTIARFIFVGIDGILSAWSSGNTAWRLKNNAATSAYTGLAIGASNGANYLYAADFRAGKIEVWDKNFNTVNTMAFKDAGLPAGYAPFNIQAIADKLFVTYARVGPTGMDEAGVGNGYVSIFNTDGSFVRRLASKGSLNSPWGVAMAPPTFVDAATNVGGTVPMAILVGNFGDGKISAFSPAGDYLGQLKVNGQLLKIDGLWAISFPPVSAINVNPGRLYFTAGPNKGADGLFGYIIKTTPAM